jgi:pre-mRNA-splicing factor RBM22/SLT11
MKLHQLPQGLIPGAPSGYFATPYGAMNSAATMTSVDMIPQPPGGMNIHYPSQDPARLGTIKKK